MASQKDVELILKAKIDQGDSLAQANTMGKSIADSIETAFEGIGERLADKLLRELQGKLGGLSLFGGGYQTPQLGSGMRELDPNNMPSSPAALTAYHGENNSPLPSSPAAPIHPSATPAGVAAASTSTDSGGIGNRIPRPQKSYGYGIMGKLAETAYGNSSYLERSLSGLPDSEQKRSHSIDLAHSNMSQAIKADGSIAKYEAWKMAKELGGDIPLNRMVDQKSLEEAKVTAQRTGVEAAKEIGRLEDVLSGLRQSINDLSRNIEKETDVKKKVQLTEQKEQVQAQINRVGRDRDEQFDTLERATGSKQALNDIQFERKWGGLKGKVAGGFAALGAAGAIASHIGNIDGIKAYGDIGKQDLASFEGRDIGNEDFNRIAASRIWGGNEALKSRAGMNAGLRVGGELLQGLGVAGAGAALAIKGGPIGWIPGAAIVQNGVSRLSDAYQKVVGFEGQQAMEMRKLQGAKVEQYRDVFDLSDQGRSLVRQSYMSARHSGAEELDRWLSINKNGDDLYESAKGATIDRGTFLRTKKDFANIARPIRSGSNIFEVGDSTGERFDSAYKSLQNLQGKGFNNIIQSSALFSQGMGRGDLLNSYDRQGYNESLSAGMREMESLTGDLLKTGMDKQTANEVLERVGAMSASQVGGQEYALQYAKNFAGAGAATGTQAGRDAVNRGEELKNSMLSGGDHLGGLAKMRLLQKLEEENGTTLSDKDRLLFLNKDVNGKWLADKGIKKSDGGQYDLKDIRNLTQQMSKDIVGGEEAYSFMAAASTGVGGTVDSAETQIEQMMKKDVDGTLQLPGAPSPTETSSTSTHTSDGKEQTKFSIGVEFEKTLASFSAMDAVMPNLNEQMGLFKTHIADLAKQMNEINSNRRTPIDTGDHSSTGMYTPTGQNMTFSDALKIGGQSIMSPNQSIVKGKPGR